MKSGGLPRIVNRDENVACGAVGVKTSRDQSFNAHLTTCSWNCLKGYPDMRVREEEMGRNAMGFPS